MWGGVVKVFRSYYPFLALLQLEGFGPAECNKLFSRLGASLEETFRRMKSPAGRRELSVVLERSVGEISWDAFERRVREIEESETKVVCIADPDYPQYMRDINQPPPLLYHRGFLSSLDRRGVAIVGTRRPSPRGAAFARALARDLSRLGVMVVSGLARGIDTAAHEGSLEGTGPAVGVIGTGLDVCYPRENRSLMEAISSRGCLLTEQHMGTLPVNFVFPLRNRLISALSRMVVVVEADRKSGANITARWAIEQGREVGAVPGFPGDFRSRGVNKLLKMGAALVESADDVLEAVPLLRKELPGQRPEPRLEGDLVPEQHSQDRIGIAGVRPEASKVLEALTSAPTDPDTLATFLGMDISLVQGILLDLEVKGVVDRDLAGCYFKR